MPKRLKGRDQTKSGLQTKNIVTEIGSIDNATNVTAGAVMMLLREGQPESQRRIGTIEAPSKDRSSLDSIHQTHILLSQDISLFLYEIS